MSASKDRARLDDRADDTYSYKDVPSRATRRATEARPLTVGVETPAGDGGTQVSYLQPSLTDGTAIACTLPTPAITTTSVPAGTAGVPVRAARSRRPAAPRRSRGRGPPHPRGLTLDPATGAVGAFPTVSGTYPFKVTVTVRVEPVALGDQEPLTLDGGAGF